MFMRGLHLWNIIIGSTRSTRRAPGVSFNNGLTDPPRGRKQRKKEKQHKSSYLHILINFLESSIVSISISASITYNLCLESTDHPTCMFQLVGAYCRLLGT